MPDLSSFLTPEVLELVGGGLAVVAAFAGLVFGLRRARRSAPPKRLPVPPPTLPREVEPPEGAVAVPTPAPVAPPAPPPRRAPDWRGGLAKSRAGFIGKLEGLLRGKSALDPATLDDVEGLLFGADLGVKTADAFLAEVKKLSDPAQIRGALEARAQAILAGLPSAVVTPTEQPHVILVVGVNGSGKTTTIGKLAARYVR